MSKSIIWRSLLVLAIIVGWTISMFPPQDQPFLKTLRANVKAEKSAELETLITAAEETFETAKKTRETDPDAYGPFSVEDALQDVADNRQVLLRDMLNLRGSANANNKQIISYLREKSRGKMRLGLDLRGGTEFLVAFDKAKIPSGKSAREVAEQIVFILRNRLDQFGTLGAEIKPLDEQTISIKIPSVNPDDVARFRRLIEQSARLEFRLVSDNSDAIVNNGQDIPDGFEALPYEYERDGIKYSTKMVVSDRPEELDGGNLTHARAELDQYGKYLVTMQFDQEGGELFLKLTTEYAKNNGHRLAIVLDGMVKSAPMVSFPIAGGSAQITGDFSREECQALATVLASGSLPVDIKIEHENSTNPTLGTETIKSGTLAAGAGLLVVVVFMVVYYMVPGIIADIALVINAVLVLGSLPILDATITLPGIAGIVLTIGMAVDANVLIFERIREELEDGKSMLTAVRNGYDKVFSTILDSNLTTLFTAMFLYKFGSGPLRGFAVTLSVGIIASMFTSLFVTRLIFDFLLEKEWLKTTKMLQMFKRPNFNFMASAKLAAAASAVLILASVSLTGVKGSSALAVDFVGGTQLNMTFHEEVAGSAPSAADVAKALEADGFANPTVNFKTSAREATRLLEIVLKDSVEAEAAATKIANKLNATFEGVTFMEGSTNEVGALVGKRFTRQAALAVIMSLVVMILYITIRFEFGYAIGAVICLAHDVIICVGVFLLTGRHIDLNAIAAILTIIGYSLNDTIVVFDRIRENLGLMGNEKFSKIVNLSINQTLSRTILTSLTTLFVVITLYIWGGGAINDFAFIMIVGVISGTYSTIFIATPIMYAWHNYRANASQHEPKAHLATADSAS